MRYGSRVLDIAKGKNAIEIVNMDDLIAVIEDSKSAVETGELDAAIEAFHEDDAFATNNC